MGQGVIESGNARSETPDLLLARMLDEFTYCPRLFYLEWIQSQFAESIDTLEGQFAHRRVRKEEGALSEGAEPEEIHAKSVNLSAPRIGLTAKIDLLEGGDGKVVPVDYNHGNIPDNPVKSWEPERVQLCAQGIILRESGFDCQEGALYYVQSRQRVTIPFNEEMVNRA